MNDAWIMFIFTTICHKQFMNNAWWCKNDAWIMLMFTQCFINWCMNYALNDDLFWVSGIESVLIECLGLWMPTLWPGRTIINNTFTENLKSFDALLISIIISIVINILLRSTIRAIRFGRIEPRPRLIRFDFQVFFEKPISIQIAIYHKFDADTKP